MIKKTQIIELFRNIEKTMVSFVSITMFILLAMCLFLGIEWANTGFKNTIESDLNIGKMQDIEIAYKYYNPQTDVYVEMSVYQKIKEAADCFSV